MNPEILALAEQQAGAFTAQQARQTCRWEALQRWVTQGLVVRESPQWYRLAAADQETPARVMRAELFLGRPLVACLYTAARLHGFGVIPDGDLHVTTSEASSLHPPAGVVVHQRMLRSPAARTTGILATSPADTAIDVAAIVREIDVLAVLDSAVRAGVTPGSLQDAFLRAARRRGIVQVRDQLPLVSAAAESAMESRTRFRLHEASLPRPELQIPIRTRSGVRRLDMGWRAARVGLEFDGQEFHSGDGSLDRDRERGRELLEAGWSVLHITGRDVYLHPERFTGALRVLLRDRM